MGLLSRLVDRWRDGQARADHRAGEVVAMLYNINRDTKQDPKGKDWTHWFPQDPTAEQQADDEMFHAMKMFALMQNARHAKA